MALGKRIALLICYIKREQENLKGSPTRRSSQALPLSLLDRALLPIAAKLPQGRNVLLVMKRQTRREKDVIKHPKTWKS